MTVDDLIPIGSHARRLQYILHIFNTALADYDAEPYEIEILKGLANEYASCMYPNASVKILGRVYTAVNKMTHARRKQAKVIEQDDDVSTLRLK